MTIFTLHFLPFSSFSLLPSSFFPFTSFSREQNLLRKKAAEELKKEQERKAEERKRMIIQRTGKPKPLEDKNEAALQALCREYHKRIVALGQLYSHFFSFHFSFIPFH